MFKLTRVVVLLCGLVAALAATAGSASASSWTNSGSTAFTATAGAGTITTSSSTLTCTGETMTGRTPAGEAGPNYTISITLSWAGCRLGGIAMAASCSQLMTVRGPVTGGVSFLTMSLNCSFTQGGREVCRLTGPRTGSIRNAAPSGPAVVSLDVTSSLSFANGSAATCPYGVSSTVSYRGSGPSGATVYATTAGTGSSGVLGVVLSQP